MEIELSKETGPEKEIHPADEFLRRQQEFVISARLIFGSAGFLMGPLVNDITRIMAGQGATNIVDSALKAGVGLALFAVAHEARKHSPYNKPLF